MGEKIDKTQRILTMQRRLLQGEVLCKPELAKEFRINERSVQRDIDDLRAYLHDESTLYGNEQIIVYDQRRKGYVLSHGESACLSVNELVAIAKVMLDSRALLREDMGRILNKLLKTFLPHEEVKLVENLIRNELHHYVELRHKKNVLPLLQDLSRAIQEQRYITISYEKSTNKEMVTRKLSPLGICFSEYYFYLTAYMDREERSKIPKELQDFPTIYRLDRIHSMTVEEEHYQVPSYTSRYQEAEFRKRIQFMYGGRLQRVTFTYVGHDIDAILDRLPTATITWYEEATHTYHIRAEVYGTGIWRWIRSQGEAVTDVKVEDM